jgi:hypothetical protein
MYMLTKSLRIKTQRKVMSLLKKIEVSDKFDWKMRIAMIKYDYDVNEFTICFIKKNKEKLRGVLRPVLP